jgi:hypothetical protein
MPEKMQGLRLTGPGVEAVLMRVGLFNFAPSAHKTVMRCLRIGFERSIQLRL